MRQPAGVILAGGRAARMGGGDKGLLPLGDTTILDRVVGRLGRQVSPLALNANGDPARFARFGLPVLGDSVAGYPGPLAGVLAGLDWAAALGLDAVVTVAADTPFFPEDLVVRLGHAAETAGTPVVLAATSSGRHPTFGLWRVDLRGDLRRSLRDGTRKVMDWADRHGAATAMFPDTPVDPFLNVNTPEDLARARALVARDEP
jgi:molybdopterin-guanine dinucleotide biosynthesis protein A